MVDAANLGVDCGVFSLFAGLEADIFVGEAGGALNIPVLKNVPCLVMNAFPYFFGLPHSWIYYKTVREETGKLVHYSKLFSEYPYNHELPGMPLHENSSDEISRAVSHFIGAATNGNDAEPDMTPALPNDIWVTHAENCRLSPAFLELFETSPSEVT